MEVRRRYRKKMEFMALFLLFVLLYWKNIHQQRQIHRYWVHPILQAHTSSGQFALLYEDLRVHPDKFRNYTRMSIAT